MARPLNVAEILQKFHDEPSTNAKKEILQTYKYNTLLHTVLRGAFDDSIEWYDFGGVKWEADNEPLGLNPSSLDFEVKKAHLLMKSDSRGIRDEHRRILKFQDIVSSMHKSEADIFVNMMKKNLKIRGLTKRLVQEVYPDLLEK